MTDNVPPDGLHVLEYARNLLECHLGWPAKSNLEMMADCLRSIGISRKLTPVQSYKYMLRAIKLAKEQSVPVDRFFFMEGRYTEMRPEKAERFPVFDREALRREREALEAEQSTPEWEQLNAELRATLARIAGRTVMPS